MLIPCRPSAFDLAAIQTTAKLVQLLRKPAFVVFTAGPPNAPRVYPEAGELVAGFGTPPCPAILPDRAAYRHASAEGRTVTEAEPGSRGGEGALRMDVSTAETGDTGEEEKEVSRKPRFANLRGAPAPAPAPASAPVSRPAPPPEAAPDEARAPTPPRRQPRGQEADRRLLPPR